METFQISRPASFFYTGSAPRFSSGNFIVPTCLLSLIAWLMVIFTGFPALLSAQIDLPEKTDTALVVKPLTCEELFKVNQETGNLESVKCLLIKRGSYQYLVSFTKNADGIIGTLYSEGGVLLQIKDEIIFVNTDNQRAKFTIESVHSAGSSCYFFVDEDALGWLASANMQTIYLKDNQKNTMFKFPVVPENSAALHTLLNCLVRMSF